MTNDDNIISALFISIDGKTAAFPEGVVEGERAQQLLGELVEQWDSLAGSRDTKMTAEKLYRAEKLRIANDEIHFEIERHPANHNGSTRACLQTWSVDLRSRTAGVANETYRQLTPKAKSYTKADAKKDAQVVLRILSGRRKNRGELVQDSDGSYSLRASSFADLGEFKQTRQGRTRQFIAALCEVLEPKGWVVDGDPWSPKIQIWKVRSD